MKKIIPLFILMISFLMSFGQKSKKNTIEGSAFNIGVSYSNPTRTEFDKYIAVVSDSLNLTSSVIPKTSYGFSLAYTMRKGKSEFEAGGSLGFGIKTKSDDASKSNSASLSTSTIDIHFGFSNYIAGPLFIGFDLGATSNAGKFETSGTASSLFEETPESHNPFKGYIFSVRPKAGFFLPFKPGTYSGIKLNVFYDYGLSKYEFYKNDIFQKRLKNYTGATKSSLKGFGVQVALVFGG
jgi:hypothetical protein